MDSMDIEVGALPTSDLGALATEAQAEDEGANGANSGNGGREATVDQQVKTAILDLYV